MQVAHAPGMSGTFSPPPRVSDPDKHHGTCVTHVPWCMSGSLTCGFLWSRWRGKRSRHPRRMRNPQFCVSGKRPIGYAVQLTICAYKPLVCSISQIPNWVLVIVTFWMQNCGINDLMNLTNISSINRLGSEWQTIYCKIDFMKHC